MRASSWLGGLMLVAGLAANPVHAQKSADTLRVTWRTRVSNPDPYYNQFRNGLVLALHVWDGLLYRDPDTFQVKGLLARSYKWVNDTTLEFEMRPGATFHNGDPVTADDVIYTIQNVTADKQIAVPSNYDFIEGAEQIDDVRLRVKLKRVFPAAVEYIAMVLPIWPKSYREKVGVDGYARAPVGAGPYKIARISGSDEIELKRYDGYYGDSPKGKPAIGTIIIHQDPVAGRDLADLLNGRVDWIWQYSPDLFDTISRVPTLQALRAESMRIGFIGMDAAGRTGAGNPLTKEKVRQAIFHAIDRQAMAKQLMQGGSRALDTPCFPTQFGCDATAAVHYDYNPDRAKHLLAEAGYPEGFETKLVTYEVSPLAEAMRDYLNAVGIKARLTILQTAGEVDRAREGKNPLDAGDWGSYSINDVSAILPYFFGGGDMDCARDPEVQKLVEAGGSTIDPDLRRKSYSDAIRLITQRALWLPLYTYSITYGFTRELNFRPSTDEIPRFYSASWK
ncbi:MAG: ABC transporter substrate-binding protein [Acetobacteraceae bacterium]|nr:ABC transporter substrate-binding protein [Acetobacteraceae bacterium]